MTREMCSFDLKVASEYSVYEAILLEHLYSLTCQPCDGKHLHDGRTWVCRSARALSDALPCFSERTIRYTIEKLSEHGLVCIDQFNDDAMYNTKWYALTDKAHEFLEPMEP